MPGYRTNRTVEKYLRTIKNARLAFKLIDRTQDLGYACLATHTGLHKIEMGWLLVGAHRGISENHLFQFCVFRRGPQHSNERWFGGSNAVIFKCTPCSLSTTFTCNKGHYIDNHKQRRISHKKI